MGFGFESLLLIVAVVPPPEIQLLRGMRDELMLKLPASQKYELRERLRQAVEQENYELAAILRDELRMMKDSSPTT